MNVEQGIYAIHDAAAKMYMTPWFANQDQEAQRLFASIINSGDDSMLAQSPSDFTLYKIGTFDTGSGNLTSTDPFSLGNGIGYKRNPPNGPQISDGSPVLAGTPGPDPT